MFYSAFIKPFDLFRNAKNFLKKYRLSVIAFDALLSILMQVKKDKKTASQYFLIFKCSK